MSWEDRLELTYRDRWLYPSHVKWPEGPWDKEPDLVIWMHQGVVCVLNRSGAGVWCGYACCFPDHPFFNQSGEFLQESRSIINVHGGITWDGPLPIEDILEKHRLLFEIWSTKSGLGLLTHLKEAWSFGFDCNHGGDLAPTWAKERPVELMETYRTQDYARLDTETLAEALGPGEI